MKSTIIKPIIIIGCPRSGTSLLFTLLSASKHLWSLYRESNLIWSDYYKFKGKRFNNEILTDADLDEASKSFILREFHKYALNNQYIGYFTRDHLIKHNVFNKFVGVVTGCNLLYKSLLLKEYRIVEKTPKNCFRISFINKLFEDCKFIFIKRDGRSNINSLIEGWRVPNKYIRRQELDKPLNIKGYEGTYWKYVLPPNWENYVNKSLEEVCAFQWISSNKAALDGLSKIDNSRKYTLTYEDLAENTYDVMKNLCEYVEIPFSNELEGLSRKPPLVNFVTKPEKEKWKKNINLIQNVYPIIAPMMKELNYTLSY